MSFVKWLTLPLMLPQRSRNNQMVNSESNKNSAKEQQDLYLKQIL